MKLQIDTENKTIKLESEITLSDLFKNIKKLLPNDWNEYSLISEQIYNWTYPVVYNERDIKPMEPYYIPTTTCNTYNVEIMDNI